MGFISLPMFLFLVPTTFLKIIMFKIIRDYMCSELPSIFYFTIIIFLGQMFLLRNKKKLNNEISENNIHKSDNYPNIPNLLSPGFI